MTKVKVDFSDTESRGGKKGRGARKHYPPGDYAAKCTRAELVKSSEKETPGIALSFKITRGKFKDQDVSDTLWLSPKALWRVRQMLEAMGVKVPSKAVNIDTTMFKGKEVALSLDDDEYDDKVYSRVVDAFLLSELDTDDEEDTADEDEDVEGTDTEDEDVEETTDAATTDDDDLEDLDLDL